MGRIIGYLRSGLSGQDAKSQLDRLKASGATEIFQEMSSGKGMDRPQLQKLMANIRTGDTVLVTRMDCIARNTKHLLEIIESLNDVGVTLKVIDNDIDTAAPHGEIIRKLLGAIADFECRVVRENQAMGIARAKREGRYKGRKPTARAKADEVLALNVQGLTRQKIADQLGIGVASVYRILKNHALPDKARTQTKKKSVDKPKRLKRNATRQSPAEQLSFF